MCICRVIQVDLYQLFGVIQRVHYIIFANDKRMSYANKLCIHTGAVVSLKPKDWTPPYLLLFLKSKLSNIEEQQIYN